jgi:amino acid adenylation domain-containing protein
MGSFSIPGRFAQWVGRAADEVAVSCGEVSLSYRELDERSNQVAHRLVGLGVGADSPVVVLMGRSVEVVVAVLGVLKAGGCYVPLHSAYPLDRKQWIVDSLDRPVLLTDTVMAVPGDVPDSDVVVVVDDDPELAGLPVTAPGVTVDEGQLAYVIYTSGSTGHPKGVAVTHRDVLGLVSDRMWDGDRHERVLMVAPYAFNVSTYELWVPLLRGGRIVVGPSGGDLDVATLARLISTERITGVHLTAGLFRVVAEEAPESLAGVREVLTGGDVIAPGAVARVLETNPDITVRAMWGATELTLFSTHYPMTAGYRPGDVVPVGGPMDNVTVHVLDPRLNPVAAGEVGEVYITGRGVARGYHDRPDLTAERFVADPFGQPGERMYRTGDLMRRNTEGLLEFVGRAGDQVKIMGFRVELGEIEAVLARYPGLAHVAVVAKEAKETSTGEKQLIAYVVAEAGTGPVDTAAVRTHLTQALPDYMIPTAIVTIDALPLTPNGKLDRRALPDPDLAGTDPTSGGEPQTEQQRLLHNLFTTVLGIENIGIHDSFFDLGGQSMLAMRITSRIRAALNTDLTISEFFDAPSIADLDHHLNSRADTEKKAG